MCSGVGVVVSKTYIGGGSRDLGSPVIRRFSLSVGGDLPWCCARKATS